MLTEERFAQILEILNEKKSVTVTELCRRLDASESTIRRDLISLAGQGRVNKVHGGATLPENQFIAVERSISMKEELNVAEKAAIGRYAASLITAEDFVFIDAGTTTYQLVTSLAGEALQATYVTNGVAHARLLVQKGCRVYLPGGQLKHTTEAIIGGTAMASLRSYNFTKAFMGVDGLTLQQGYTTPDIEEARLKETAIRQALETWFLADSSKFGKLYRSTICPLTDASIITDRLPEKKYNQYVLVKECAEV